MSRLIDKDALDEEIVRRWAERLPGDIAGRLRDIDAATMAAPVVAVMREDGKARQILCLKDVPEDEAARIHKEVQQQISTERMELLTAGEVFDLLDEMGKTEEMKKIDLGELVLIKVRWKILQFLRDREKKIQEEKEQ